MAWRNLEQVRECFWCKEIVRVLNIMSENASWNCMLKQQQLKRSGGNVTQLHEGGMLCVEGQQGQEPWGKSRLGISKEQQKGQCDWSRGNMEWRRGQRSKKLIEDQVKQGLKGNYKDFRFLNWRRCEVFFCGCWAAEWHYRSNIFKRSITLVAILRE